MKHLLIKAFVTLFFFTNCKKESPLPSLQKSTIIVNVGIPPPNNGGLEGTYIDKDSVYNITSNSAKCRGAILRISKTHNIIGYGHVWSLYDNPTLSNAFFISYGKVYTPTTFVTFLTQSPFPLLKSKTDYYIKTWLAIENQSGYREIIYSKIDTHFKTL